MASMLSTTSRLTVKLRKNLDPLVPWEDITCILWHNGVLFTSVTSIYDTTSGCNGRINIWDKDLNPLGHFEAHAYALYYMCAGHEDTIYTSASDSTICHWRIQKSENHVECVNLALLKGHLEPAWRMQFFNNRLFSGDELGEIRLWENDVYQGVLETFEEIWDLLVIPRLMFTVRNLEVTVTTLPEEGSLRKACSVKNMIPGSGPLFVSRDRIFCIHRRTFEIMVYSISQKSNPLLARMAGHKSLVTGFVGTEDFLFSCDYDGCIFTWDLNKLCQLHMLSLNDKEENQNGCVNVMTFDKLTNTIYAAQEKKSQTKISFVQDKPATQT